MPIHRILGVGVALLACGLATASPAGAAAHRPHHAARYVSPHHVGASRHLGGGIPQHGSGDRDADNNGAPSDNDGSV